MLEQISTSRDRYTLTKQSYTSTKQSNDTCNMLSLYNTSAKRCISYTPVKNILQDIFCLARKMGPYLARILQDLRDFVNLARLCKILTIKGPFYLQDKIYLARYIL